MSGRQVGTRFLEGEGADEFMAAFKRAVVPADRRAAARDVLPPVVLLAEGGESGEGDGGGEDPGGRAHRAMRGLERCLRRERGGKLVPYAALGAAEAARAVRGRRPLTLAVGQRLCEDVPPRTGRLRLPDFQLMRDVVECALEQGPGAQSLTGEQMRDRCYEGRRRRGPVLRALWQLGGGDPPTVQSPAQGPGWLALALAAVARPAFQVLPRWWWARRCTRRLLWSGTTGWFADWRGSGHGRRSEEFFESAAQLVELPAPEGERQDESEAGHGPEGEEWLSTVEQLLLRALLADLKAAAGPGRVSPWRRRRATRFTVLLELGADGGSGDPAARFLSAYGTAAEELECAATVVVATGPAGVVVPGERCARLSDAATALDHATGAPEGGLEPLLAPLVPLPPGVRSGTAPRSGPVSPRDFRMGPVAEVVLEGVALVAVLGVLGAWLIPMTMGGEDESCLGGASGGPLSGRAELGATPPRQQYEAAALMIEEENKRVDEAVLRRGAEARTVVHIGAEVAKDQEGQRYNGAVPELRGIALAQRALNDEARNDSQKVWLRVRMLNGGEGYKDAERRARQVVEEAGRKGSGIIGVVAFSQSLKQTQAAVRELGRAKIPMVGTTATADAMNVSPYYRRVAPTNSREARIEADFAHRGNIMDGGSGGCSPAEAAVVVQDPADLYSKEIGNFFAEQFGGDWSKLEYSPGGRSGGASESGAPGSGGNRVTHEDSIKDVADAVCERIKAQPRTVLYWASRAREFTAFLDVFGDDTSCEGRKLTVLGGNELTTAALSGEYEARPWLRLYHTAHVLPAGHPRGSDVTQEFNAEYAAAFGAKDLWRNDGRAALAHDAMQLMAAAANEAFASTGDVERSNVQISLDNGISKEGASGYLDFGRGAKVSRDKPLVILHHTAKGSEPVLFCGSFAQNTGRVERWGPKGEFACPKDG
ncbi:hypothetical protein AB0H07_05310 [Streptomyces sp. NPDC021354]|uniref:hypothetical protein n=1 Tax=Streptomyces sp. NPDC021354 TaxID=3154793 RepID=UPI00340985D1